MEPKETPVSENSTPEIIREKRFDDMLDKFPPWTKKPIKSLIISACGTALALVGGRLMQSYPFLALIFYTICFSCIFLVGFVWLREKLYSHHRFRVFYAYFAALISFFISVNIVYPSFKWTKENTPLPLILPTPTISNSNPKRLSEHKKQKDFILEKSNVSAAPISDYSNAVSVWFTDTKPTVEFVLANNPPEINFEFSIGIQNNNDNPATITLNFDYNHNQFLPNLWKFHQMFFYSANEDFGGPVASPIVLVFLKRTKLLSYVRLNFLTQECKDKSYWDRLTDLPDTVWVEALASCGNETSDAQQNFVLRDSVLSTFKEKLPGNCDLWGIK